MMELVDMLDLGSSEATRVGSSPSIRIYYFVSMSDVRSLFNFSERMDVPIFGNISRGRFYVLCTIFSITAVSKRLLLLNEELLLSVCFAAFIVYVFRNGGDSVAETLDGRRDAILSNLKQSFSLQKKSLHLLRARLSDPVSLAPAVPRVRALSLSSGTHAQALRVSSETATTQNLVINRLHALGGAQASASGFQESLQRVLRPMILARLGQSRDVLDREARASLRLVGQRVAEEIKGPALPKKARAKATLAPESSPVGKESAKPSHETQGKKGKKESKKAPKKQK